MTRTLWRCVVLGIAGCFAFTSLVRVQAPSDLVPRFPLVITRSTTVDARDRNRFVEQAFDVPTGTSQIDVDVSDTAPPTSVPIELDIGVRAPNGVRGWSQDRRDHIHLDAISASYGYLPGPIQPGLWTLIVGIGTVPDGATASYQVTIRLSDRLGSARPVLRRGYGWYAGDLHTHSGHSDGYRTSSNGVRLPVSVQDLATDAATRGLDFVAITDHNTTSHWVDVDRVQMAHDHLLVLHGQEVTTYEGHVNAIGARQPPEIRLTSARPMSQLMRDVGADGAFVSINHPWISDDAWCPGCRWTDVGRRTIDSARGLEIVNGPTVDELPGWELWATLLNAGHRLVAVGGSDTHDPVSGDRRIAQPTTVVFASALSEEAIVDGLGAGRVYIRTESPNGPALDFWASQQGRRIEMGETADPGRLVLTASLERARDQDLAWLKNGHELCTERLRSNEATVTLIVDAVAGDWFSLIVRRGRHPTAVSNAIYVHVSEP